MDRLAILVNDAAYAARFLNPLLGGPEASATTIVMCPPKLSHRIGKWLSNRQRQQWQRTWADELRLTLLRDVPQLPQDRSAWIVAPARLKETTGRLRMQLGTELRILDLRRQNIGQTLPQADGAAVPPDVPTWTAPAAVTSSLAAVLALVD